MAANGHLRMRHPVPGPRGGGLFVSEQQRARLLDATFAVVAEQGYRGMVVRAVSERAGVSSKTFYDLFSDREDCFLAAFDYGIGRLAASARPAYEGEREWVARMRAGLGALLAVLDRESALTRLLFVESLAAGPRVLERRAQVLGELMCLVDEGRVGVKAAEDLPRLMAEGVVGATFGVIHSRLLEQDPEPLAGLLGELMATIVLPYRGRAAAAREQRRAWTVSSGRGDTAGLKSPARLAEGGQTGPPIGTLKPVDFRLTVRTRTVLVVVCEHPGLNNQQVSELAGIADQGQISRLMMRLSEQGLLENTRGHGQGVPKAWHLTPRGEALVQANSPLDRPVEGGGLSIPRGGGATLAPVAGRPADIDFRLTVRTYKVLAAIAELRTRDFAPSNREIARAADVRDQGQISKLLARLEGHGLLTNTGGQTQGIPNAWSLTRQGEETLQVSRPTTAGARQ